MNVSFCDQLHLLKKGVAHTHLACVLTYPMSLVLSAIRLLPREWHAQTCALMAIRRLFNEGVVPYGTFVTEKR